MGLISPGGENLLDFLELQLELSTYDLDLRDMLWWPHERPVLMQVARGLLGIPLPSMPGQDLVWSQCRNLRIPLQCRHGSSGTSGVSPGASDLGSSGGMATIQPAAAVIHEISFLVYLWWVLFLMMKLKMFIALIW